MRRVTCKDCHKQYDYDKDDFCPKCGSFTHPSNTPTVVKPVAAAPARGTPAYGSGSFVPHSVTPQYSGATPEVSSGTDHSARLEACEGCEETPRRRKPLVVVLAAFAVVISLVLALAPNLMKAAPSGLSLEAFFSGGGPTPEKPESLTHDLYESFSLNEVSVSIDDAYLVDISSDPKAVRVGYDCLAVTFWVDGGIRQPDLYIDVPALLLEDGTAISPEDDVFLKRRLQAFDLFPVALSDYQWEDPLYGHLIYYIPSGTTDGLTLQMREFDSAEATDESLVTTHYIPLELAAPSPAE